MAAVVVAVVAALAATPMVARVVVVLAALVMVEVEVETVVEVVEVSRGEVMMSANPAAPFGCEPAVERLWQEHPPWVPLRAS